MAAEGNSGSGFADTLKTKASLGIQRGFCANPQFVQNGANVACLNPWAMKALFRFGGWYGTRTHSRSPGRDQEPFAISSTRHLRRGSLNPSLTRRDTGLVVLFGRCVGGLNPLPRVREMLEHPDVVPLRGA